MDWFLCDNGLRHERVKRYTLYEHYKAHISNFRIYLTGMEKIFFGGFPQNYIYVLCKIVEGSSRKYWEVFCKTTEICSAKILCSKNMLIGFLPYY